MSWSDDRGLVPAGGRHPFAGVLRRQEARRVQRRLHPARCRSTRSSSGPRRRLPAEWDRDRFAAIAPHIQERLVTFDEVPGKVDFLFWPTDGDDRLRRAVVGQGVRARVGCAAPRRSHRRVRRRGVERRRAEGGHRAGDGGVRVEARQGPGAVRVAVTGRAVGPPLFESLEVLGRAETLRRLELAVGASDRRPTPRNEQGS